MYRHTRNSPNRPRISGICLLAVAALAACDADPTGPAPQDRAIVAFDRNAYVATPSVELDNHLGVARNAVAAISTLSSPNVIVNGRFEAGGGSLTGWTQFNEGFSPGSWFVQSGTSSPISGFPVRPPTDGARAAMTDQFGPGTHVLYQDVTVPAGARLSFDVFIANRAGIFWTPASLSFNVVPNQQARVDIVTTTSSVLDVGPAVIANLFRTDVGDTVVSGYETVTTSLASLAGRRVRIRFGQVETVYFFQTGIDNVSLRTTYDDLCESVRILVAQPGIQNALCSKLSAAAAAEGRGGADAQNGILRAFTQQVEAQAGKSITEADAALLISAAESLMAA